MCAVTFNVEGDASKWLRYQRTEAPIYSWAELCGLVIGRFDPRAVCPSHLSAFARVQQSTMIEVYIKEFEELSNCVYGFNTDFKIHTFLSDLKTEIRQEVEPFNPTFVLEVTNRALMQERKVSVQRQFAARPQFQKERHRRSLLVDHFPPGQKL